ncbi:MAG: hypothetical protein PHX61_14435 [Alphaproteobacteria bacterium]|nr:hypothetical protein [Alphaproteobacteria bacterium]
MIVLKGFFGTQFLPVAIAVLLGIYCLWRERHSRQNRPLLFIAAIFGVMIIWRLPVVISPRYVLPVIVPGLLLAVLFMENLAHWNRPVGKYLCGLLLVGIAVSGTIKALRFQESKPYLTEIPKMLQQEMKANKWNHALALILGNFGGYIALPEGMAEKKISGIPRFTGNSNQEDFFQQIDFLNPDYLLLRYPVLYLFVSSQVPGEIFAEHWKARYGQTAQQCCEFIRSKDQRRYQVFRVDSPYPSGYLDEAQRLSIYKRFNLLPNPDFSEREELSTNSLLFQEISDRGATLGSINGHVYIPVAWQLEDSLWGKCLGDPEGLEYTKRQKLRIFSNGPVAIRQASQPFTGGKIYQLGGWAVARKKSSLYIRIIQMSNKKPQKETVLFEEVMQPGRHEFSGLVDMSDWPGEWIVRLCISGDLELENLYLVDPSIFVSAVAK